MVKGSGSVGMWSTCKVVHHVHAVGALVHQAERARSLNARLRGGPGGKLVSNWLPAGRAGGWAGAALPARLAGQLAGLVSVSTTCTNFFVLQKQKNVVQFFKTEL